MAIKKLRFILSFGPAATNCAAAWMLALDNHS